MTRMRAALPAIIALGSNVGDREATLRAAATAIDALDGVRVVAASRIVETPALTLHGVDDSRTRYLNAVIKVRTSLSPNDLLAALHDIESELGRVRVERWGDRTIDLDLIDYAGLERHTDSITLPHPRAWERAFVLAPWLEIDPNAHVVGRGAVADLLADADDEVHPFSRAPLIEAAR